jgi:hypothetical protein
VSTPEIPACRKCGTGDWAHRLLGAQTERKDQEAPGDIKGRKLNSLISGFEFPDKPLIIPCSIQGKKLVLAVEVAQNEAFRATNGRNGPAKFMKFPVFFPVSREFRPEKGSLVTASSAMQS